MIPLDSPTNRIIKSNIGVASYHELPTAISILVSTLLIHDVLALVFEARILLLLLAAPSLESFHLTQCLAFRGSERIRVDVPGPV